MSTIFIFLDPQTNTQLCDNNYISMMLDCHGNILHAQQVRTLIEIQHLQANDQVNKTIVVLPSTNFSIHSLLLPKLKPKKIQLTIPYILEDQLSQNLNELDFFYSRKTLHGEILVAICSKSHLQQIIHQLKLTKLKINIITLDWYALLPNEIWTLPTHILIYTKEFCGSLSHSLYATYSKQSSLINQNGSYEQLSKRLLLNNSVNLYLRKKKISSKHWYYRVLILTGIILPTFIGCMVYKIHLNRNNIRLLTAQIIQQTKNAQPTVNTNLWFIISKITTITNLHTIAIERLQWHNNMLQLVLIADNIHALKKFQNNLFQNKIKIKQIQASATDNKITTTIELSI